MGYHTSLNLKVIIAIVSFKQNINLKIQILAGNTLMSRFHVSFEIALPLVVSTSFMPILPLKAIKSKTGLLAEVRNMKFVTNSIHWTSANSPFWVFMAFKERIIVNK